MLSPKLIITALGLAGMLWPSTAESPIGAGAGLAPVAVSVEHELVFASASASAGAAVRPRPRIPPAAVRLASVRKPASSRKPDGIAARAGRMLIGDGRYRPEPFPRPGR